MTENKIEEGKIEPASASFPANEADSVYGNKAEHEEYGYVTRGLKARHIQFIALGGTIGTGLFLGIGEALTQGGPLSILLGYTIVGISINGMMTSLGEMCTWLPLPGAIPQFCCRYVDEAMGFAVGWNNWYSNAMTVCVEISAASIIIQFWPGAEGINVAAWISICIVLILSLNIFAVSVYGEAEFIFASVKIVTILGLIICGLVIDLGGVGPQYDRIGFRYWNTPGAMREFIAKGDKGRFLGWFSTLIQAAFSFSGVETVAVAAGEAENPRRNIPKAVRRVFWRILFFYVIGALIVGMIVPYDEPHLLQAQANGEANGAQSPWVVAVNNAGIPALPSIINAVLLTSAFSAANAFLYVASRYLFALAQNKQAPRVFLKCTKRGVPWVSVLVTASISLLTYMSTSAGANAVFTWFQNLTTVANIMTWISVCISYIRFRKAMAVQGVSRDTLHYKAPLQPYACWFTLCFFCVVVFFNGFSAFCPWNTTKFLTAYLGVAIYFALYAFWKILKRTSFVSSSQADLWTGKAALDAVMDGPWPNEKPRNILERVWFWIA